MMVRQISLGMALLVLVAAGPAFACSIEPPPPMTQEEKAAEAIKYDRKFVEWAKSARAILEVKAITRSGENESSALFEVRRVFNGRYRKGAALKLKTIGTSLCGAGGVRRRESGIIIISATEPKLFNGFLWSGNIKLLQNEGILPASASPKDK